MVRKVTPVSQNMLAMAPLTGSSCDSQACSDQVDTSQMDAMMEASTSAVCSRRMALNTKPNESWMRFSGPRICDAAPSNRRECSIRQRAPRYTRANMGSVSSTESSIGACSGQRLANVPGAGGGAGVVVVHGGGPLVLSLVVLALEALRPGCWRTG